MVDLCQLVLFHRNVLLYYYNNTMQKICQARLWIIIKKGLCSALFYLLERSLISAFPMAKPVGDAGNRRGTDAGFFGDIAIAFSFIEFQDDVPPRAELIQFFKRCRIAQKRKHFSFRGGTRS